MKWFTKSSPKEIVSREITDHEPIVEQPQEFEPRDGIYNPEILQELYRWYYPSWRELGFATTGCAQRRGQKVMKNNLTKIVNNVLWTKTKLQNITMGYDPQGEYRIKDIPSLNVGSLGVRAWWNFSNVPSEYRGKIINPVLANVNIQQYVLHPGLDYNSSGRLKNKQQVRSCWDGVVVGINYDNASGNYIIIRHAMGLFTFYSLYMHLAPISIAVNKKVSTGDVIGVVGNTGSAQGLNSCHLHFELRASDMKTYYDPITFIGVDRINKAQ